MAFHGPQEWVWWLLEAPGWLPTRHGQQLVSKSNLVQKAGRAKDFVRVLKRIIGASRTMWSQGEEEAEKTPMGHLLVQPWPPEVGGRKRVPSGRAAARKSPPRPTAHTPNKPPCDNRLPWQRREELGEKFSPASARWHLQTRQSPGRTPPLLLGKLVTHSHVTVNTEG